jgi:hypothetical protein
MAYGTMPNILPTMWFYKTPTPIIKSRKNLREIVVNGAPTKDNKKAGQCPA